MRWVPPLGSRRRTSTRTASGGAWTGGRGTSGRGWPSRSGRRGRRGGPGRPRGRPRAYACPRSLRSLSNPFRVRGVSGVSGPTRGRAREGGVSGVSDDARFGLVRSLRVLVDPNAGDDVAAPGPGHGSARDELLDELLDRVAGRPDQVRDRLREDRALGLDDLVDLGLLEARLGERPRRRRPGHPVELDRLLDLLDVAPGDDELPERLEALALDDEGRVGGARDPVRAGHRRQEVVAGVLLAVVDDEQADRPVLEDVLQPGEVLDVDLVRVAPGVAASADALQGVDRHQAGVGVLVQPVEELLPRGPRRASPRTSGPRAGRGASSGRPGRPGGASGRAACRPRARGTGRRPARSRGRAARRRGRPRPRSGRRGSSCRASADRRGPSCPRAAGRGRSTAAAGCRARAGRWRRSSSPRSPASTAAGGARAPARRGARRSSRSRGRSRPGAPPRSWRPRTAGRPACGRAPTARRAPRPAL